MIQNKSNSRSINDYKNAGKLNNNSYESILIKSINEFSFRLYSQLIGTNNNLAYSPLTIYNILKLLSSCSNESIRAKLTRLLGHHTVEPNSPVALSDLLKIDKTTGTIESKLDLITREGFLKSIYSDTLKAKEPLLGIHESKSELDDKLNELGLKSQKDLALVLESLLGFNIDWKVEFNSLNEKGAMNEPLNQSFEINLMKISNQKFMYCKNPLGLPVKICEYPIGDGDLTFVIILANKNSLQTIESQLNAALFEQLVAEMHPVTLNSTLPEFSINHRLDVRQILKNLGLTEMCEFSSRENGLYVSQAFYECSIHVGSKQIKATQRDCFVMRRGKELEEFKDPSILNTKKELFFCDNSFLYFIRNKRNKLILFMGRFVALI